MLAWRLLHDPRLADVPGWLRPLIPAPAGGLDRDPAALLLGATAAVLALAYLGAALAGAGPRLRAWLIALAGGALVVAPTAAFVALGFATDRPYGQDGGVVQLPLALEKILAGESPYGADYSDSILGKQARVSDFWAAYGENPILRHHAYLPGTHLLVMPFYLVSRGLFGAFDPRFVTLLAYVFATLLAARLGSDPPRRLAAAALVAVNPLVYWHQIFGANDVMVVALLLLALQLAERGRATLAGAAVGLACATKQLAWPFAPFLLAHLSGATGLRGLLRREALGRLARPALASAGVFLLVVAPVAGLDLRAFWGDIVVYNVGLPGGDSYPLGGTPGFGFANFLIYFGAVDSLRATFPFGVFYLLLIPLGLLLLRRQLREASPGAVLVAGSAALLASLYFSRVVHPNYLILAAILLPLGLLAGTRLAPDAAVVPLLLLAVGVEVAEHEVFRTSWEDAAAAGLPRGLMGIAAVLAPRAGPHLTSDPLGLVLSATAAGLAVLYLLAGILGLGPHGRLRLIGVALVATVVVPALLVVGVGRASGRGRSQHPWTALVLHDAQRAGGVLHPPLALEAWSSSFRRDPPGHPVGSGSEVTAGGQAISWILGRVRLFDPRVLSLVALALSSILLARLAPGEARPLALGAVLPAPIAAVGVIFGSGDVILLAAVLGAWALSRRDRAFASGLVLGLAAAVFPRALLVAPFALIPGSRRPRRILVGLGGLLAGFALLSAPVAARRPELLGARLLEPVAVPGLGLLNLFLYWGLEGGDGARVFMSLGPILAGAAAWTFALRRPGAGLEHAAAFLLLALLLSSASSPDDLLVPTALLLLGRVARADRAGGTGGSA